MSIPELQAAIRYEDLLNKDFRNVSLKEVIPKTQEEFIDLENEASLQQNLARNNLNTIYKNQPSLVTNIIQSIIDNDGDLTNFNKFFPTFRITIAGQKLPPSLAIFESLWKQFKTQQLGQILQSTVEAPTVEDNSKEALQTKSEKELDTIFKNAIVKKTGSTPTTGTPIQYRTYSGTLSKKDYKLIILPDPNAPSIITGVPLAKSNDVKIRYILEALNPGLQYKNISVNWKGPKASIDPFSKLFDIPIIPTVEVAESSPKPKSKPKPKGRPPKAKSLEGLPPIIPLTGSGLYLSNPSSGLDTIMALKKKSVHSRFR